MPRFRALTGAFGILLMLALGAPAFAHDQLIATVPQDGAALTDGPTEVTLTFSDDVLTVGTEVIVADGDGRHWVAGTPEANGADVTVPLTEALPEGGYEVRWRVVSGDGHPISGRLTFTVGDAQPLGDLPAVVTETDAPTDADTASEAASTNSAIAERPGWLPGVLVAIGGAGLALTVWFTLRYFASRSQ